MGIDTRSDEQIIQDRKENARQNAIQTKEDRERRASREILQTFNQMHRPPTNQQRREIIARIRERNGLTLFEE